MQTYQNVLLGLEDRDLMSAAGVWRQTSVMS